MGDQSDDSIDLSLEKHNPQKLREKFVKHFLDLIIEKLNRLGNIFETHGSQSKIGEIASTLASETIGRKIASVIKITDSYITRGLEKKIAKKLEDLIHYYKGNRNETKKLIEKAGNEIFNCFEGQFVKVTCNGGPFRAMEKLAFDAVERIFNYLVRGEKEKLSARLLTKGVLFGKSCTNTFGVPTGRTVENGKEVWKTKNLFEKCGINYNGKKYRKENSKPQKYGYRLKFRFEVLPSDNWQEEEIVEENDKVNNVVKENKRKTQGNKRKNNSGTDNTGTTIKKRKLS